MGKNPQPGGVSALLRRSGSNWWIMIKMNLTPLARGLQSVDLPMTAFRLHVSRSFRLVAVLGLGLAMAGVPALRAASAADQARAELAKTKEQANAQRDKMIAEYETLAKQLKDATEEQKKAILAKMEERKKAFEEAQSALHKQIRDEQRRQRQNAVPRR